LPRDLGDVLHYFIPEVEPGEELGREEPSRATPDAGQRRSRGRHPAALPLLGVPIGAHDVVRAAFAWNLSVEVARLGGRAILAAPDDDEHSPLWPEPGVGPLGAELVPCKAAGLGELHRAALDVAVSRAPEAEAGGVVLVRIPPLWLREPGEGSGLLRWVLLFSASERSDLLEAYGITKLMLRANPRAEVGVTLHGARRVPDAERAFERLARASLRHLGRDLVSYGLLVDDLDVYRAIVAQRPVGLSHPQSPAARALRDVAQMVLVAARKRAIV